MKYEGEGEALTHHRLRRRSPLSQRERELINNEVFYALDDMRQQ